VMVGKKEVHVERMLGESLIKKLIKIWPKFRVPLLIPQIRYCRIIRPLAGSDF
jgi:hypothetical protein